MASAAPRPQLGHVSPFFIVRSIHAPDPDLLFAEFQARAGTLDQTPVQDTPWGTREFHVRDPDGNGLQFYRDL